MITHNGEEKKIFVMIKGIFDTSIYTCIVCPFLSHFKTFETIFYVVGFMNIRKKGKEGKGYAFIESCTRMAKKRHKHKQP